MPVPVPRQRAVPAAECGPAQVSAVALTEEAHRDTAALGVALTVLLVEDDPSGALVPELRDSAAGRSASVPPATSPRPAGCSPLT